MTIGPQSMDGVRDASYSLLYDARADGLWYGRDLLPVLLFVAVAIVMAVLLVRQVRQPKGPGFARSVPVLVVGGLVIAALGGAPLALMRYKILENRAFLARLEKGDFTSVEGAVVDFVPQDSTGHPIERFRVGSHTYEVSHWILAPGYHTARWEGGPITPGMYVRIAEIDGHIARAEVRR